LNSGAPANSDCHAFRLHGGDILQGSSNAPVTAAAPPTANGAAREAVVEVDNISKRFGRTLALDGLSLRIIAGESFALLGPNGAGKSTLIHILCTILRPDSGSARICGHDIVTHPAKARAALGAVFQEPSLDTRLTVAENLEFHGMIFQVPARLRRQRIEEMLEMVDLVAVRNKLVRALSPGMKRRVEIARALVHDARILILDEPTIGLDIQSRHAIWQYLDQVRRARDITVIVTTHYIEEVDGCDRVCIVDRGRVHALDTPDALRSAHGRELVRVHPRSDADAAAIRSRFERSVTAPSGEIIIESEGGRVMETLLSDFGPGIRHLSFERPSLESAFINLVGRTLRSDPAQAPAGPRGGRG